VSRQPERSTRDVWTSAAWDLAVAVLFAAGCIAALDYVAVTLGGGW
jgi:hypothetical protein